MATRVEMPKMGYDMTEGTILAWSKHEGDDVAKGDVLGEIETGKVNIEIEAFDAGILRRILVPEGETVAVGTPIAIIAGADEDIGALLDSGPTGAASDEAGAPADRRGDAGTDRAGSTADRPAGAGPARGRDDQDGARVSEHRREADGTGTAGGERVRASPLARRMASEHGIPLAALEGTGPSGRIVRDDVLAAVESGVPGRPAVEAPAATAAVPQEARREALSAMRRTIARRLTESWTAAPHIFLTMPIRMDAALALRREINAALEATGGGKVSVNDLVVKAAARALRDHPRVNVSWDDGARVVHPRINVGVAVALDDGLITITLADADQRPISAIAAEVADKASRARAGKLTPNDLAVPSTFTVSNLGMYGIEDFTAIINPPEAAILAVGAAIPTAVVDDGTVVVQSVMKVTLSADHRVVDGAAAAEFLVTFKQLLEHPLGMLV